MAIRQIRTGSPWGSYTSEGSGRPATVDPAARDRLQTTGHLGWEINLDSERLSRWLTLGANLGVLLGIALLILELQQNRSAMRAETRSAISQGISDQLLQVALDPELSELRFRADSGGSLTEVEKFRYELMQRSLLRYWENVHYQYRVGLYDESEYLAHKRVWAAYINHSEALRSSWCSSRDTMSEDFGRELNSVADSLPCDVTE